MGSHPIIVHYTESFKFLHCPCAVFKSTTVSFLQFIDECCHSTIQFNLILCGSIGRKGMVQIWSGWQVAINQICPRKLCRIGKQSQKGFVCVCMCVRECRTQWYSNRTIKIASHRKLSQELNIRTHHPVRVPPIKGGPGRSSLNMVVFLHDMSPLKAWICTCTRL